MFPRKRYSLVGFSLLALLLAWGCGDGGGCSYRPRPGSLLWARRAGGDVADWGRDVAVLSDDSVVVAGEFMSTALFASGESEETSLTSLGGLAVFVARYDAGGALLWARSAEGPRADHGYGVGALSDDSVAVTGYFEETVTFGPGEGGEVTLTSAGGSDVFLARYNSDGTLAWARRAGGASGDFVYGGIAVLSDDSVVVTGSFAEVATFGQGDPNQTALVCAGVSDIFIARYNADGTLAWAKRAGGTAGELVYGGVAALSDDSVAVTGLFRETATFGQDEPGERALTSAGGSDVFIARYGSDGALLWVKRAGGAEDGDVGRSITALSDDAVVVLGEFSGEAEFGRGEANENSLASAGSVDVFIARYNGDGSLAWARRAGGGGGECGQCVATLSDDSAVVTGYFYETATFGPDEAHETILASAGYGDGFLARYGAEGSLVWARQLGGTASDRANALAPLSTDSLVVTGGFGGTAVFGQGERNETRLTSAGFTDIFIARYNP